jgi:hypothetical protein
MAGDVAVGGRDVWDRVRFAVAGEPISAEMVG